MTKMQKEFFENVDVVLSSIVHKEKNRENISKSLWKKAHHNYDEATYMLYEIFADYLVSPKLGDIYTNMKNNHLSWEHPRLIKYKDQQKEYDDFLLAPPEVEEGVIECHYCHSKKTFSFSKQTRRADESATVFVRCANCGKSFRM
jgi:DNA-directed RNA polymerase subunit M/transcription elongation factor TFIIS